MQVNVTTIMEKTDLGYYDELRKQLAKQNIQLERSDVISVNVKGNVTNDEQEISYDLRHIIAYLPLTASTRNQWFDLTAAAFLAIDHINNRNATVVPEISTALDKCNIKFTLEAIDSKKSPFVISESFLNDVAPRHNREINPEKPFPTAILGEISSPRTVALGIVTGVHDVPLLSPSATATVLDNKVMFPLFARLIPSDAADARLAVNYLATKLNVTHCAILYVQNTYGLSFFQAFDVAARQANMTVHSSSIQEFPSVNDVRIAIQQLKASGFKYFIGVFFSKHFKPVMKEAYNQSIAGEGYFWMFSEGITSLTALVEDEDIPSEAVAAAHGAAQIKIVSDREIFEREESTKAFMSAWNHAVSSPNMRQYVEGKIPGIVEAWRPSDTPSHVSLIAYDSIIAMTLAACDAKSNKNSSIFNGRDFYDALIDVEFHGTFGPSTFDKRTGGRRFLNVPYAITNLLFTGNGTNRTVSLKVTDLFEEKNGSSSVLEWKSISPFVFSDGTTTPPKILPPAMVTHETISNAALIIGYALCALTITSSLFFCAWSIYYRNSKVIRKSQPFFLIMLCVGTLVMGSTIIPLSFKDPTLNYNLDAACQSTPWLFSTGFIITFSALFSKTNRIYKIFHHALRHRRLAVKPVDVIKPFFALFLLNFILLTLWTTLDPLEYELRYRDTFNDRFGRPVKSYGFCSCGNTGIVFLSLIVAMHASVLVYANFIAYRARNIATEYSESAYIALSMASILQAVLIGIPVVVVSNDDPTAHFLILSILISIMAISTLVLMFVPKFIFFREWKKQQRIKEVKKEEKRKRNENFLQRLAGADTTHCTNQESNTTNSNVDTTNTTVGLEVSIKVHGEKRLIPPDSLNGKR